MHPTRYVRNVLAALTAAAVVTLDAGGKYETLISQVNWGAATLNLSSCSASFYPFYLGADAKSWPTYSSYTCPSGPHGNYDANPNPLVATAAILCLYNVRTCSPTFEGPSRGTDTNGAYARVVAHEFVLQVSGSPCEESGSQTFISRTTSNYYDTSAECAPPPPTCEDTCGGDEICLCLCYNGDWQYGIEGGPGACVGGGSPLLINLSDAAYHLTSLEEGVSFDLDADGKPNQSAWTRGGDTIAFLALDRNNNGSVDSGAELFGNFTQKADGTRALNGFEALSEFDDDHDGIITVGDLVFPRLLLWTDRNHNGYSEQSELITAAQGGIVGISTSFENSHREDRYGNALRYVGWCTTAGPSGTLRHRIFDVFLVYR